MRRAASAVTGFGRRHRALLGAAGALLVVGLLAVVLVGRRHDFAVALSSASIATLLVATALQVIALLARSEAWHGCINAAGGTVDRRILFRASSMGYVGGMLNAQLGTAARIAALRRSAPAQSPAIPTLVAAELPIVAVEAVLAALTSFTLVGPLGLPWWLPVVCLGVVGALSTGLRHLALRKGRELWQGLAVLRSLRGGRRLVLFVLLAVLAQIARNWLLLRAVGVDASLFDAIAVLIAMVSFAQLPMGPGAGAAAAVLILGRDGVAAVAAAGILTTVTGTVGGLSFAAWAGADRLWSGGTAQAALRRALGRRARRRPVGARPLTTPALAPALRFARAADDHAPARDRLVRYRSILRLRETRDGGGIQATGSASPARPIEPDGLLAERADQGE